MFHHEIKLSNHRVGHSIAGNTFLADEGQTIAAYKNACKQAYGNLRGVKFHEFAPGTELAFNSFERCWIVYRHVLPIKVGA